MNKNVKIAKELVKLAKSLIANDIDEQTQRKLDEAKAQGKKYILHHKEGDLWRIMACRDILLYGGLLVQAGDFGGLIESEKNLSHDGNCWVYDDAGVSGTARVYGNAKVYGDASVYLQTQVYDNAQVYGRAQVCNAQIYGNAKVYGNVQIVDGGAGAWYNLIKIYGDAQVYGNASISSIAQIYGNAQVYGNAQIRRFVQIHGNAKVDYDVRDQDQYQDQYQEITE